MSAIPDNFEPQASKSNYVRITPGKHRLRVLDSAISGYVFWENTPDGGRKPTRVRDGEPVPMDHAEDVKKFLALPVWNYTEQKVQIWEITQASIQKELKAYDKDKDWGSLLEYDIEVERVGTDKMSTKYRTSPKPKAPLEADVVEATKTLPNMELLFDGGDPFASEGLSDKQLDDITF